MAEGKAEHINQFTTPPPANRDIRPDKGSDLLKPPSTSPEQRLFPSWITDPDITRWMRRDPDIREDERQAQRNLETGAPLILARAEAAKVALESQGRPRGWFKGDAKIAYDIALYKAEADVKEATTRNINVEKIAGLTYHALGTPADRAQFVGQRARVIAGTTVLLLEGGQQREAAVYALFTKDERGTPRQRRHYREHGIRPRAKDSMTIVVQYKGEPPRHLKEGAREFLIIKAQLLSLASTLEERSEEVAKIAKARRDQGQPSPPSSS